MHVRFARRPPALAQIARRAGGRDILPGCPASLGARQDMVEGQLLVRSAIDTAEFVAKEEVESSECWIFVRPDELAKRDDRRKFQRRARTVYLAIVMGDHVHTLEEHGLDRRLPRPEA